MVRLFSDAQMDEKCKEYRPVPLKLYRVVYGLAGRGANPLTTMKSDRMISLPGANINLATKSNIPLTTAPASKVELQYKLIYDDIIVKGNKLDTNIRLEDPGEEDVEEKYDLDYIRENFPEFSDEDLQAMGFDITAAEPKKATTLVRLPDGSSVTENEYQRLLEQERREEREREARSEAMETESVAESDVTDLYDVAPPIERVINTVVDAETGEIEELVGTDEKSAPKEIVKPDARKGLAVINGRGVQGVQGQTDSSAKKQNRKGGKGGKSQPAGVGIARQTGQTAPDKKGQRGVI